LKRDLTAKSKKNFTTKSKKSKKFKKGEGEEGGAFPHCHPKEDFLVAPPYGRAKVSPYPL
jgi:hypothetical protein